MSERGSETLGTRLDKAGGFDQADARRVILAEFYRGGECRPDRNIRGGCGGETPTVDVSARRPHTWGIHPPNVVDQLVAFADEQGDLASLWSALDDCDLGSRDMVLFPISRPLIIVRVGAWIARRASRRRPNVFFRFTGGELVDRPTGQTNSTTALFRLACSDLNRRHGQDRVFLLADTMPLSQMMTRVCCRRAFPISAPIYHALPARGSSASNTSQTVYVHLNRYSGRLTAQLYEIIRRVRHG